MLERYTLESMKRLWLDEETKFFFWLQVELAVLKARVELGLIPDSVWQRITLAAKIDVSRIKTIEAQTRHDMIAFIKAVQESLQAHGAGDLAEEFHRGLTSYDVEDPAQIIMLRVALEYILEALHRFELVLYTKAKEHQWTLMIARTHGQFAEPDTFGHLLLVYATEISRCIRRLQSVLDEELSWGKISGAVGSFGGMDPRIERTALGYLNLKPALAETQILQRDRHAVLVANLAVTANVIGQMARTFWEMMRSEVLELREGRIKTQRGSSAMAHKRNPILTEQLQGLPRLFDGMTVAALANIATPEGRDISQSSVERHILPDATSLLHYMVVKATALVEQLEIFPERMRENLEVTSMGVWAGQRVRDLLMTHGVSYDDAYLYMQTASFEAQETRLHLSEVLAKREISEGDSRSAMDVLGSAALADCFDAKAYVAQGIEHIFIAVS